MPLLADGTFLPAEFGYKDSGRTPPRTESFDNVHLRHGEVIEVILPNDKRSVSKKFQEYKVLVQHRGGDGAASSIVYQNCYVSNIFGGAGDLLKFTFRPKTIEDTAGLGQGSKVVILCLNGETSNALIIAGLRDGGNTTAADGTNLGHHLIFSFNGIDFIINDDGELSLRFSGATKADGSLRDGVQATNSGTFFKMTKDGSMDLGNGKEHLAVDHQNNVVTIQADQDINVDALKGALKVHTGAEIHMESDNKGITLKSPDNQVFDTPKGVLVGSPSAAQAFMLGTRFRSDLTTQNTTLMSAILTAETAVIAAQALCTAIGVAIVVPIAGAIATAPMHAALAVQLGILAEAFNSMGAAVQQMEAVATTHTSIKNFSDQ